MHNTCKFLLGRMMSSFLIHGLLENPQFVWLLVWSVTQLYCNYRWHFNVCFIISYLHSSCLCLCLKFFKLIPTVICGPCKEKCSTHYSCLEGTGRVSWNLSTFYSSEQNCRYISRSYGGKRAKHDTFKKSRKKLLRANYRYSFFLPLTSPLPTKSKATEMPS